ncbi:MerR family transcriptional regulator [Melittangium boletus]|uniref:HTH merR-type domain-containing protein n=1 Tax=Melittangium boletus DSM 14713 TaxID=1294270 RepID=A0A250I6R2_9BACT|nr:MerR family transcriptional regulator [Melittangium boletus]ATB27445.1 hypothetical protein MEBOL_000887 [Melittangium boletus DSM 14713]
MRLLRSREVQALTGLSADQLREWTGRRGLVAPDVPPRGKGTQARFSWQTVLVLRLAVVLKQEFHVELKAQRELFAGLQRELAGRSFPTLWPKSVVLHGPGRWELLDVEDIKIGSNKGCIVLPFASHLEALSVGFGLPDPMQQLPLFAAVKVQ